MISMAIVKATYTISSHTAKASIRYITHRPGSEGKRTSRVLFTTDGMLPRYDAYKMIEQAGEGSVFYRFAVSPDPRTEDTHRDLHLRQITEATMWALDDRLGSPVLWVAATHDDHAPHRHVHVIAVVPKRLSRQDLTALRDSATQACRAQRLERDTALEARAREEEAEWGREPS